jgi:hypothetical protein
MPGPRISRRRFYATLVRDALAATSGDAGGKSSLVGIAISIGAGIVYVVLTGNRDNPVLVVLAGLVPALVLLVGLFLIHLALAPARLHEHVLDRWETNADSLLADWKESSRSISAGWKTSNDEFLYHILELALLGQLGEAANLRERLATSERGEGADDGGLRAQVDSWDGNSAGYVEHISEAEKEFYLRASGVPTRPGTAWQEELRDFILIREDRLEEIKRRHEARVAAPREE